MEEQNVGSSGDATESIHMNPDSLYSLYSTGSLREKCRSVQQEREKEKVRKQEASESYAACKEESKQKKKDAFE
eukprot:10492904-Ditylum_brightwellii.AAC.1